MDYVLCVYVCMDGGCVVGFIVIWKIFVGVLLEFVVLCLVEIINNFVIFIWDELGKFNGVI